MHMNYLSCMSSPETATSSLGDKCDSDSPLLPFPLSNMAWSGLFLPSATMAIIIAAWTSCPEEGWTQLASAALT